MKDLCSMAEEIINRVANSALKSIDLDDYLDKGERAAFDIKQTLFQGLILREKDFRAFIKENDWSVYNGKNVRIYCSEEVVIPTWAYMLLVTKLEGANLIVQVNDDDLEKALLNQAIGRMMEDDWQDAKVVIKGCGDIKNVAFAYTEITKALVPVVSSLMFGEPCSTVPVYKKPRK